MPSLDTGVVDITREFLQAHELLRRLILRHRDGSLRFEDLQEFVGDNEASVLFRLKERCHALFRSGLPTRDVTMTRGALFDLAVGSLFHEAMKLRENVYQVACYGPKVRALRAETGPDADRLFEEFEKILAASEARIEEAFQESETLLEQLQELFRMLLSAYEANGLLARYLLEHAPLVEQVLDEDLDRILERVHGEAFLGYVRAAQSYLTSGYFEEAGQALAEVLRRRPGTEGLERLAAYAEAMRAYLGGHYDAFLTALERWIDASPGPEEEQHVRLARSALSRVGALVEGPEARAATERAAVLLERLEARSAAAVPPS